MYNGLYLKISFYTRVNNMLVRPSVRTSDTQNDINWWDEAT